MQHLQGKPQTVTLAQIAAENDWKNDMVLWVLPLELRAAMPRIVNSWVSRSSWEHLGGMFAHVCLGSILHRWLPALPLTRHAHHDLCFAGTELPDVLGAVCRGGSRLGMLHLRRGRGTVVQGAWAAIPQGHGAPSRRERL
jgi:hypothetical protein